MGLQFVAVALVAMAATTAAGAQRAPPDLLHANSGLVAAWGFQEPAGSPRHTVHGSEAANASYALTERKYNQPFPDWCHLGDYHEAATIQRVEDSPPNSPFGPYSAELSSGQLFAVPRASAPLLNVHGDNATLSMVAWIKPATNSNPCGDQYAHVAGFWSEQLGAREFVIFAGTSRGGGHVLDVEVSRTGVSTPNCTWSVSYALGTTKLEPEVWHCVAMTFDGSAIRAYINGTLDARQPEKVGKHGCHDTWANPAPTSIWTDNPPGQWGPWGKPVAPQNGTDFTVGGKGGPLWGGSWGGDRHPWVGRIGGLALYKRALDANEIHSLCSSS